MKKRKVRKSITNRFKVTKTGKVMRRQGFRRHIKSSKSSKQLRRLKKIVELKGYYAKKVKKAVGKKVRKGFDKKNK
jgi:large subunit ribosomal protein L35